MGQHAPHVGWWTAALGLSLVGLLVAGVGGAATINVAPGQSVQAAIDSAQDRDEIVLAPGTYHERIAIHHPLTVRSSDPDDPLVVAGTVLDGDAGGHVVAIRPRSPWTRVYLRGLTITDGLAPRGGGVYAGSHTEIVNCRLIGNKAVSQTAPARGGGVYFEYYGSLTGCELSSNYAEGDGGGACFASYDEGWWGSLVAVNSSRISQNVARGNGGGVLVEDDAEMSGNRFDGNRAGGAGGGLSIETAGSSWHGEEFTGNVFLGNQAGRGGAMSAHYAYLSNCLLARNVAPQGAAVDQSAGYGYLEFVRCTIADNQAGAHGAAIRGSEDPGTGTATGYVWLHNCILAGNAGGAIRVDGTAGAEIYWTDFFGNAGGNLIGSDAAFRRRHSLLVDPLFVNPAGDDYHLRSTGGHYVPASGSWVADLATSPCLDAADPASAFDREPQPNGGRADLGAYGNSPEASKTPGEPAVRSANLAAEATGVSPKVAIQLVFTQEMQRATVQQNTTLTASAPSPSPRAPRAANVIFRWDGNQKVTVYSAAQLALDSRYVLQVSTGALATGGAPLGADFRLPFTTRPALIANHFPAAGAAGLPCMLQVRVNFGERLSSDNHYATGYLVDSHGNRWYPVSNYGRLQQPGQVLRLDFRGLPASKTLTFHLGGLKLLRGGSSDWDESFSFSTGDHPAVIAYSPSAGWVALDTPLALKFNRPMVLGSVEHLLTITPAIAGTHEWRQGHRMVIFRPTGGWVPSTDYSVRLGGNTRSADGAELATPLEWTFRSASAAAGTAWVSAAAVPLGAGGAQVMVSLTTAACVQVTVCNIGGRVVAVLPAATLPRGVTALRWNGRSDHGTGVPPGTYLLRVTARTADGGQASALASCTTGR